MSFAKRRGGILFTITTRILGPKFLSIPALLQHIQWMIQGFLATELALRIPETYVISLCLEVLKNMALCSMSN
jgi:hypothetical protein